MKKIDMFCKECDCDNWQVRKRKMSNGRFYHPWCCGNCGHISAYSMTKNEVIQFEQQFKVAPKVIL